MYSFSRRLLSDKKNVCNTEIFDKIVTLSERSKIEQYIFRFEEQAKFG